MNSICINGKILPADKPVLMIDNKSYRYGDGLFETMKVINKRISLEDYHFERFFSGIKQMGFEIPALVTKEKLSQDILFLCEKITVIHWAGFGYQFSGVMEASTKEIMICNTQ